MAFGRNKANIKADLYNIYIDGVLAPYHGSVNVPFVPSRHNVTSAASGDDVIAVLVQGRSFDGEIVFKQATGEEVRTFLGVSLAGDQPHAPLGSALATHEIRIRRHGAADETEDYVIAAAVLHGVVLDSDGLEEAQVRVPFTATVDASGDVLRIGKLEA